MRKVLISVLLILCVILVAGCNGQGGVESSDVSNDESSVQEITEDESGVSGVESVEESQDASEISDESSVDTSEVSETSEEINASLIDCELPCAIEITSSRKIENVLEVLGDVGHVLYKFSGTEQVNAPDNNTQSEDCGAYFFDSYEQFESVLNNFYEIDRLGYLDADDVVMSLEDYLAYTQYDDLASSFSEYFEGENPNGVFVGVITYTKPSDHAYHFDSARFTTGADEYVYEDSVILFVNYDVTQEPLEENPYASSVSVEEFQSLIIVPNEDGSLNNVKNILSVNQSVNVLGAVIAE